MPLRKIADLNTPDLLLCEKMPGGFKLSAGINRSELVGFANTYGYLLPPDKMLPHLPGKSVPPLETEKARWDAWVSDAPALRPLRRLWGACQPGVTQHGEDHHGDL